MILHYHLFKNAGTSLDQIFQRNFPDQWVTREFSQEGRNNTEQVEEWIASEPDAVVFSSHTAIGPLPQVPGVEVFPVLFLRDPIDRIRSAYRFERAQDADTEGARLAKAHNFEGYVRAQLSNPHDRQCKNFQTGRLAAFVSSGMPEFERAVAASQRLPFIGLVEHFDESLRLLNESLQEPLKMTDISPEHANAAKLSGPDVEVEKRSNVDLVLALTNTNDRHLIDVVKERFHFF